MSEAADLFRVLLNMLPLKIRVRFKAQLCDLMASIFLAIILPVLYVTQPWTRGCKTVGLFVSAVFYFRLVNCGWGTI